MKSRVILLFCFLMSLSGICSSEMSSEAAIPKETLIDQAFSEAIQGGALDEVKKIIIEGRDPNKPFGDGLTPLHAAVIRNQEPVVILLLQQGAKVDAKERTTGATPLHLTAVYGRDKLAKLLIQKGADVNERMKFGITPLHTAAQFRQLQVAELLLNKKADINRADDEGYTALHFAAQNGDEETVRVLIRHGADKNRQENLHNKTPLMIANEKNHKEVIRILEGKQP